MEAFLIHIIHHSVDIPLTNSCWQFWYISVWQYYSVQLDADNLWNRSDKIISNSSKEIKAEDNTSLHPSLCLDLKLMHAVYTGKPYFLYYPSATHCGGYIDALWFGVSVCVFACVSCLDLVNAIETKAVRWYVSNFADILDERMSYSFFKDQGHHRQKCKYLWEHNIDQPFDVFWSNFVSDWEGKGPCAIVPLTWKKAHQSLCRMIRNGPLKISKSLKKAENGPLSKISSQSLLCTDVAYDVRINPIDFGGQRLKVTIDKKGNNFVNTTNNQNCVFWSYLAQMLPKRRWTLLLLKVRGQGHNMQIHVHVYAMYPCEQNRLIHFANCLNGYSAPVWQKSMGQNSNSMGQNCYQWILMWNKINIISCIFFQSFYLIFLKEITNF